ncbi:MAG: glycosyltransferase family 4 protein [Bryobacterales bacterium]|nr:glycosyltransferase family 4 protein [Bryobacterales bacterium]
MHILFLADNFPPEKNAQASRVYERACYWVRWGHQVTVITCAPNFPEGKVYPGYTNRWFQIEEISGIRVVRVKTYIAPNAGQYRRILDFLSFMITAFVAGLFQPAPDVIAATSPQFFAAVAGWALSKLRRRHFVFELSDLWPESIVAVGAMRQSLALKLLERFELVLYRQSSAIIALTPSFRDNLIRRGIEPSKINVVTNGVELSRFCPRRRDHSLAKSLRLTPNHFVVGYIGTLGMAHNLENVLAAAASLRYESVRFLFVGPGAERDKLISHAQRLDLDNVIFVPPQPKDCMPNYWSVCDVALVHLKDTPLFETVIPSKIFEAMGMGKPILLVAPEGEASRIVLSEQAGVHVPPANPVALASAIRNFASSSSVTASLAANSLAAAPRWSRERQARDMLAAISSLVPLSTRGFIPVANRTSASHDSTANVRKSELVS